MRIGRRIAELVAAMTLEEKVAQLSCIARTSEATWLVRPDGLPDADLILARIPAGASGDRGLPDRTL